MKDFRLVLCRGLRCGVLVAALRMPLQAQNFQSTTALTANTPTLVLPGSLTLTSVVNQSATPGGVPTGTVSFTYDQNTSLGTPQPLTKMPSTQSFPAAPTDSINTLNATPAGILAVDLFATGKPVLVTGNNASSGSTVSVFPNLGFGNFGGSGILSGPALGGTIDQIASGFFLNKTTKSALVHQPFSYNVYNGTTSSSGALANVTSPAGPGSSSADVEVVAIDDFDGDGYSDVGVLIMGEDIAGIALNEGSFAPGTFAPLVQATLPTALPSGAPATFCVDAITTGKFNPAFNAQLAVLGHFGTCTPPTQETASYLVLYAGPTGAPNFTPASGTDSSAAFSVTLSDSTPGATIYYTTDQTTPTTASPVYSAPIPIPLGGTVINALAVAADDAQSAIASGVFYYEPIGAPAAHHAKAPSGGNLLHGTRTLVGSPRLLTPLTINGSTLQPVGTGQTTLASADFNQDGKPDLLIGSATGDQVQLYYGNGDGTFTPAAAANNTLGAPLLLNINDFNGDGYPDVAMTLGNNGGLAVLLNDGAGNLKTATQPFTAGTPSGITSGDFNSDGLPDLALLQPGVTGLGSIQTLLSAESAQASLVTAARSLPAGTHTLVAAYSGDTNFFSSTSATLSESVTQTTPAVSWPAPAPISYPTPLSSTQLDATASVPGTFTYASPPNCDQIALPPNPTTCVLPTGSQVITATFNPTDSFDYTSATAQVTLQVSLPAAVATVNIPSAATPGAQPSILLTLSPYPVPVTATITLSFVDSSTNPATSNGSINFVNVPTTDVVTSVDGHPTDTFTIGAGTTAAIPPRVISAGTVAGTITVTIRLTTGGVNITPSTLVPTTVTVAPSVPIIQNATVSGTGGTLQVVVVGSSSTREISAATFHFTPVAGLTIKTPDVTIQAPAGFTQWFTSPDSAQYGSSFTYTQPFTLNVSADVVDSVTVTLGNGQGTSQPSTAQNDSQ